MLSPKYLDKVPYYMHESLRAYVLDGKPVDPFLYGVLSNDLKEAIDYADTFNILALKDWVSLVYNAIPFDCQGSRKKVDAWVASGGHNGRNKK